jgi:hypothetical protein
MDASAIMHVVLWLTVAPVCLLASMLLFYRVQEARRTDRLRRENSDPSLQDVVAGRVYLDVDRNDPFSDLDRRG